MVRITFTLLLALLFSLNGFCQNNDSLQEGTIRIGRYRAMIANKIEDLHDSTLQLQMQADTVTIAELLKNPIVKVARCSECKVTSFVLTLVRHNSDNDSEVDCQSNNEFFTDEMIKYIKQLFNGEHVIFENVNIKLPDGSPETAIGKNIWISESLSKNPNSCKASLPGINTTSISARSLSSVRKIQLQNCTNDSKITSFMMWVNGTYVSGKDISHNEYFTQKMINLIKQCSEGTVITINDVHVLENGEIHFVPGIELTINDL